jgi:hypothetical protein
MSSDRILPQPVRRQPPEVVARNLALMARNQKLYELEHGARRRGPRKLERAAPEPSHHYARASAQMYRDARMNRSALALIHQLIEWARGRGKVDAYVGQLADRLGVSERTIQRAQNVAEQCGYIRIERVREGRLNDANVYHLLEAARPPRKPFQRAGRDRAAGLPIAGTCERFAPAGSRSAVQRLTPRGATNLSPHEKGSNEPPPYNPPEGMKMRRPHAGGRPAVNAGAGPAEPDQESGNPLSGGANSKIVPAGRPPGRWRKENPR